MMVMLLLKATLLWSGLLVGVRLLRAAHPADRHRLWTIGFAAVLALPILGTFVPALDIPVNVSWTSLERSTPPGVTAAPLVVTGVTTQSSDVSTATIRRNIGDQMAPGSTGARRFEWPSLQGMAIAVWLVGGLVAALVLVMSLIRVQRLKRAAHELRDSAWQDALQATATRLGVPRGIRLLLHDRVRIPMAGGLWHPVIYLPSEASEWSAERRDVVLAHEIAHLARRDPLRVITARLAAALYWFHPLAWIAVRQSGVDLEEACDAAVLALGTRPSAYARLLLEFADTIHAPAPLAALPIVQRSILEKRLMAILREERHTLSPARLFLPALVSVIATVSIAAAQPVGRTPAPAAPVAFQSVASLPAAAVSPRRTAAAAVVETPRAAIARPASLRSAADPECWVPDTGGSFSGTITSSGFDVTEEVGTRDGDRVIEETLAGTRLCMIAQGVGSSSRDERPSDWLAHSDRIVMESRKDGHVARLTLDGQPGAQHVTWTVNGSQRTFDAGAQQWRDRMLTVLDSIWQLSTVRGEVSTLRGRISTVYGQESTLRGRISTLRGEVSTMRGQQSTIRGEESSLQGEISSIRGHLSSLRGKISSEQGAISSLESDSRLDRATLDARVSQHNDEIARIQREIRDYDEGGKIAAVEQRLKDLDVDGKVAAIDAQIRAFDVDGKTSAVEQQIKDLDVEGKVAAIQRQIDALDADRRAREFERQRDAALGQLQATLDHIR